MNLPYPQLSDTQDANQNVLEVRRYLFRLVETLNNTLSELDGTKETETVPGTNTIKPVPVSEATKKAIKQTQEELKSLIIKTAKDVEYRIDTVERDLSSDYVAKSEYGTFEEQIDNRLKASAAGIEQTFNTISQIMDQYVTETNGYIRQGVVGYDGLTPIIGIAIGQDITVTGVKVTVNGKVYETIDTSHNMSILTSQKLSFYTNGVETAYFANDFLHISRAMIGYWQIDDSDGFMIRWKGVNV